MTNFPIAPTTLNTSSYEGYLKNIEHGINFQNTDIKIEFNLSKVKYIDIGCLLHLMCVIKYFVDLRIHVCLKLPEGDDRLKVRDFLRRWKFFEALQDNVAEPISLIPTEHWHYLDERQNYYTRKKVYDEKGIIRELLSRDIVEITSFTRKDKVVQAVNERLIELHVEKYESDKSIGELISRVLGLSYSPIKQNDIKKGIIKPSYELFYKTFIYQSLINTKHHPNATVSMLGVSFTTGHKSLVVSVVDNGEDIPTTINKVYKSHRNRKIIRNFTFDLFPDLIRVKLVFTPKMSKEARSDAKKIFFACLPGVTSKKVWEPQIGMGLTYLVRDTARLKGEIEIRSGSAKLRFYSLKGESQCEASEVSKWIGTLIRIQLPVVKKEYSNE